MKTLLFRVLGICALMASVAGAQVTGLVVDTAGLPVVGAAVDISGSTATTTATGAFTVFVSAGTHDIEVVPATTTLAPLQMKDVLLAQVQNIGQLVLQPGFVLSGTVVDQAGLPVVNADTNTYDMATGDKLFTPSDNTGATGFFAVVVPAGTYTVRVSPPSGVLLVAVEIENVSVSGATNIGTTTLGPGHVLSGTVVNSLTLAPIAGVDLDVDSVLTGQRIVTPGDDTDAAGAFSVIVPAGFVHVTFEPGPGVLNVARAVYNVSVQGPTSMGSVGLEPGVVLSGTVLDAGGQPIQNVDIDVDTSLGSVRIITPRDNTDANGAFTVVVPTGTYDVTYEPPFSASVVGARAMGLTITGTTNLPAQTLQPGVVLSGTVIGAFGAPEAECDVDVMDPTTGEEIITPGDDTNAAGFYQAIVPVGTWDVRLQTRKASPSRDTTMLGVSVTGPTTLNATLTLVPAGLAMGTFGIPTVAPGGTVATSLAMLNTGFAPLTVNGSLVMIDPAGVESTIIPPTPLLLPPQQIFWFPVFPVAIPGGISPSLLGLPFRLEARFDDPSTGDRFDTDHFTIIVQ